LFQKEVSSRFPEEPAKGAFLEALGLNEGESIQIFKSKKNKKITIVYRGRKIQHLGNYTTFGQILITFGEPKN
jgi:hypothetical protein